MKRKIVLCLLISLLTIAIAVLIAIKSVKKKEKNELKPEIVPLQEITEEQERQTIISLYFLNPETKSLVPEARKVDVKILLESPYQKIVEFLIKGPRNEKLETVIPEGTKVNNAQLKNDIVEIDLSKEFIENQDENSELNSFSIYSIVNTLTELNEVKGVRFLVDGEENKRFKNNGIGLDNTFIRLK